MRGSTESYPKQDLPGRHVQNFDYLRLFLALEVVAQHLHAGLLRGDLWVPIPPVATFVGLSGFLIPQALERSGRIPNFALNRVFRTIPALVPLMIAIAIVFGLPSAGGAMLQYLTAGYIGKFQGVTLPLWSLVIEDTLYALMALLFVFSLHRSLLVTLVAMVSLLMLNNYVIDPVTNYRIIQTSISFFAGNLVNIYHPHLRRISWVFSALVVAVCISGALDRIGFLSLPLMVAATIVLMINLPQGSLRLPDLSYGIYIWHGPIMIALLSPVGMDRNAIWVATTTLVTLSVSIVSWNFIEKPILRLKKRRHPTLSKWRDLESRPPSLGEKLSSQVSPSRESGL